MATMANPFTRLCDSLTSINDELTRAMLDVFAKDLANSGVPITTYGDVLTVLEYLDENNAIKLTHLDDGIILIKKV